MKKIGFVISTPLDSRYAPASRIISLATLLQEKGFSCTVFCPSSEGAGISCAFPFNVEYCASGKIIRKSAFRSIFYNFQQVLKFHLFLLRNHQFHKQDFLIVRGDFVYFMLDRFPPKKSPKLILDFHGYLGSEKKGARQKIGSIAADFVTGKVMSRVNAMVLAVKTVIDEETTHAKQMLLYNGIDAGLILQPTDDLFLMKFRKQKIVIVSTLSDYYEFETVNKAVGILKKKFRECELHIFGGGPKQGKVLQMDRDIPHVNYHGFVDHQKVVDFLSNEATCGVLPVRPEHYIYDQSNVIYYPRKVLEYFSCSLPVVYPDYKGKSECLIESYNSLSYIPYDIQDCARKISMMFENLELYTRLSQGGLKTAQDFTWSSLLENSGLVEYLNGDNH